MVVETNSGKFVLSRRRTAARAELEVEVLRQLDKFGAPVPRVIAFDGTWLVQEYLGVRLSQLLADVSGDRRQQLMDAAIVALAAIHDAAMRARLHDHVAKIGVRPGWVEALVHTPVSIGERLHVPVPDLDYGSLVTMMTLKAPRFIKWDAQPGNAAVRDDGRVGWFDWEHCGCHSPLDDLGWFLGDEWTPEDPPFERKLLEVHLPAFAANLGRDEAWEYLMAFGVLHMCMRLSLILSHKGDGPWWDRAQCRSDDKVGVTAQESATVCNRAQRWATDGSLVRPLAAWFGHVGDKMAAL